MEAYNSRDNICKFHDFVLGHGHGKMAKIRETPKIKNFLLSINSKWPPRSKSCYNLGFHNFDVRGLLISLKIMPCFDPRLNYIREAMYFSMILSVAKPNHTHTVCVTYYKAAPYNISHTKIFSRAK